MSEADRTISSVVTEAVSEYLQRSIIKSYFSVWPNEFHIVPNPNRDSRAPHRQDIIKAYPIKRVAFASTAIFLRMNGYRLKVDADNGESFLIDRVIKSKADISEIADWLEKRMRAV